MTKKHKHRIGVIVFILGFAGFFFWMNFFELFNSTIEYRNPYQQLKFLVAFSSVLVGTYFGFKLLGATELAKTIIWRLIITLIIAYLIGFNLHG